MKRVFFVTDVEATGPNFTTHSMYQFASVPVAQDGTVLENSFTSDVELVSNCYDTDTMDFLKKNLGVTPYTLSNRPNQVSALEAIGQFEAFIEDTLKAVGAEKVIFVADNLAFDWGYINTYFHRFLGRNPFGYAGRNLPDISMGLYGSRNKWEEFRTQEHTHDALDDVTGNAGALSHMIRNDGLVLT